MVDLSVPAGRRRLVYTWAWGSRGDSSPGSEVTVVTVDFVPEGSATCVVLEQRGFAGEVDRDRHDHGWNGCLDNLERRGIGVRAAP
jgi:uncharacterized protein YndB with AHSA1/START domain